MTPIRRPSPPTASRFALGRALFFDKILSGAKKTSCAACHDPSTALGDGTSLGIGLQGSLPRRTPHLFTRGSADWRTAFWDSRVSSDGGGVLHTPAGSQLPPGLESVTAAQSLFPMQASNEMRGLPGELDVNGQPNELGNLAPDDFAGAWGGIMNRLMQIPEYVQMFQDAYPGVPPQSFTIGHAANAIASYEEQALDFTDTPFDRYLAGDDAAMTDAQKRGAMVFYGRGRCYECHAGSLLTDQRAHNIAVPQMGPGRPTSNPLDWGLGETTGLQPDRFLFRTPPLRNLAYSPTFMHDGAYTRLADAIAHHLAARSAIVAYDPLLAGVAPSTASQLRKSPTVIDAVLATLDPIMDAMPTLSPDETADLLEFLQNGLRDPAAADLRFLPPPSVPSGLTPTS